ncbi:37079_t:CDS:2, partial [Gigaspora margarita]
VSQLERFMSKWNNPDCKIRRTFPDLNSSEKELVLGANRDGYWDSVKLLEQRTHPGCVGIFAFDNATSHKAFSEDALVASKMNLGPGGLAPKMHETPKGIQRVLSERGLWWDDMLLECTSCKKKEADPNVIDCCARRLIANQPDFLEQRGQIQQEIESRGHK